MARDLCIEHMGGIDHLGIDMERQHVAKRRPPEVAPVPVSAPFGSFCRSG
jgi:hypothetical protein